MNSMIYLAHVLDIQISPNERIPCYQFVNFTISAMNLLYYSIDLMLK